MINKTRLLFASFLLMSINLGCSQQNDQTATPTPTTTKDQQQEQIAEPENSEWELVWSDEFDGEELDLKK